MTKRLVRGLALAAVTLTAFGAWRAPATPVAPADRALAVALLLDSPRPADVVDEGIRLAERLRRHYGIDTGRPHADRVAAAVSARAELDRLTFTRADLAAAASDLGWDLDACGTWCRNVERLATVELKRRALRRLAEDGAA